MSRKIVKLKDVATLQRGKTVTKSTVVEGDIPVISGGKLPAYYCNSSNREGETITVAGSGVYAGYVQFWDKPIFVSDGFSIVSNTREVLTKYIYYCLIDQQANIYDLKRGAGIPHVYTSDIGELEIPLPALAEQQVLVDKLDLLTEYTANLKAELKLREQQYKHYLDQWINDSSVYLSGESA